MENNFSRREFLALLARMGAVAGLASPLAACQQAAATMAPTAAPSAAPTVRPTAAPTAAARNFAGTQLNGMIIQFTYTDGLVPQIPDFEKQTGAKVQIQQFGVSEEFTKADIELASGTSAYDLISLNEGNFPRALKAGWIQPINSYIDDATLTNKETLRLDDFFKGALSTFRRGDTLYGLPDIVGVQVMYVRKDLLDKAGIKSIPATFDELLQTVQTLHGKDGVSGIAMRSGRGLSQNCWSHLQFFYGFGASLVKKYPDDMHPNLDTPEAIDAVTYLTNLLSNYSLPSVATVALEDVITNFNQGKVAIIIEGAPLAARVFDPKQSKVTDTADVSVQPRGKAGFFPPIDAHAWVIPKSSKNKEAAYMFMNWSTSAEVMRKSAVNGPNAIPTRQSAVADPAYRSKYSFAGGHWLEAYSKVLAAGGNYYGSPTYRLPIPEWSQFEDRLSVAFSEALTKAKTPAQAMKDAQDDITQLLKKAGYF